MNEQAPVPTNLSELGFDFEKARKSMETYSSATGTNCFLIDARGSILCEAQNGNRLCMYCRADHHIPGRRFSCRDVHLYGCYQAERFGGKYVFFCPIGLTHWVSPITVGGTVRGALIGGPVLMVEPEEFILDDFLHSSAPDIRKEDLSGFIHNIPVTRPEAVNNLLELMAIVTSQIVSRPDARQAERSQRDTVQARISESLQELKAISDGPDGFAYPFEKEKELLAYISLGNQSAAQKVLNEILGCVFFSSGMDFHIIRARIMELTVLLSRAAIEGGADASEIFGLDFRYLSEINDYTTVEELTYWLSRIMARFTDCVFNLADVRHKDIIYKAVDYVRNNYMKKLTLEGVSRSVYLTPSYFSKIFRDETGYSFVAYVNRIRVEKGKVLLRDPSIPLTDVSSLAGFEEQSYFTRVFKKLTGMTPGIYRKTMGIPQNPAMPADTADMP